MGEQKLTITDRFPSQPEIQNIPAPRSYPGAQVPGSGRCVGSYAEVKTRTIWFVWLYPDGEIKRVALRM